MAECFLNPTGLGSTGSDEAHLDAYPTEPDQTNLGSIAT